MASQRETNIGTSDPVLTAPCIQRRESVVDHIPPHNTPVVFGTIQAAEGPALGDMSRGCHESELEGEKGEEGQRKEGGHGSPPPSTAEDLHKDGQNYRHFIGSSHPLNGRKQSIRSDEDLLDWCRTLPTPPSVKLSVDESCQGGISTPSVGFIASSENAKVFKP